MKIKSGGIHLATIHWDGKVTLSDEFIKLEMAMVRQCGKTGNMKNIHFQILYYSLKKKDFIKKCKGVHRKYRRNIRYEK